ncbi:NAD(P)-binding protein [Runella sp. CRIBMP]|uniref:flavin-dependent oxidoreductase n=1 Tax=Runella sp. CRIBMP TaxID=2683261 RepID=UPI001412180A|nr:flavin-dependent oxidoreductase [Runella sp. CRIBMP]NBB20454.1 NAD(P)-binding protein [Runella sp. CRIBMP]
MKVLIIGGGIGGLTTALCLHKLGLEVKVFESVKEVKPLGVGINLLPHSVRVLTHLGLQSIIAQNAIETTDLAYFNKFGQPFWSEPRGRFAGYKWPQFSVHRGRLQRLLFEEATRVLGREALLTNHHLVSFEQNEGEVIAHFVNKETGQNIGQERGDLLIGSDGINSVVRQQLYPNEGPPVYSTNILYRGTTQMKPFLNGTTMVMVGHNAQKIVAYPIHPEPDVEGNKLINWVANVRENGQQKLEVRDWNRPADQPRLVNLYRDWTFDWLDVPAMIAGAKVVYEFPMSDRNPLGRWTFGRVTLLGDAAHPMYPIGSNGASQAILDADYLAECLKNTQNPTEALMAYNDERVPATAKVVLQNRAKGPDEIMDRMEERFPKGFSEDQIPRAELEEVMNRYKQIAGFDIQTLNQKS